MRISLLTDGIYPYVIGGMQKHSFYLAKFFAIHKIEVDLYHTGPDLNKITEINCFTPEERLFITSIPIQYPHSGKLPGHYIREMHSYSRLLFEALKKRENTDFIYVQGLCGSYLLDHKKEVNVPIGVNFHGLEMFQQAADLRSKFEQLLFKRPVLRALRKADVVFSLGGKLTEIILSQKITSKKISQVPIGIDSFWLRATPVKVNAKRKFIFVGRSERRKGIEELTKVIKKIGLSNEIQFEFIGAIPDHKKIIAPNVNYFGSLSEETKIREIMVNADVLICPSYSEGMPTVILEGMASGLAIIASNVGAVSEQVGKDNGLLITPGDISALEHAIITFAMMPEKELVKMKEHSIERIRKDFLWKKIITQTISEIENTIKKISL